MSKLERIFKISVEYKDSISTTEEFSKKLKNLTTAVPLAGG